MTDMIIERSDKSFYELVDQQVFQFNEIVPNSGSFFDSSEESVSFDQKIEELKDIFSCLKDIVQLDIDKANSNSDYIEQAIGHTWYILDILNDDDFEYAPWLVQRGILDEFLGAADNSIWQPLAEHRQKILEELRSSLPNLFEASNKIVIAQRQTGQLQQRLKR